jgi:5-methylcytosine-specific restriction enzyme subunit McrC
MNKIIQVYEYKSLIIDNSNFTIKHFNKLVRFNERHGNKYFTVGYQKIIFGNYVGVLNVDGLTIEILPKADYLNANEEKWRNALISMLMSCKLLKVESLSNSNLRLKKLSLLEIFLEHFLNQVDLILHKNLVKSYHFEEGNLNKLKGRILFDKHIRYNKLHRERFYTSHQFYDQNNLLNSILKTALSTLTNMSISNDLISRAKRMLLYFDNVTNNIHEEYDFNNLKFNKHNQHYQEAIQYAQFILLKRSPSLKSGKENVLAILFDMNLLFEKFILLQIKKQEAHFENIKLKITGQKSKTFWNNKTIKPDIIFEYYINENNRVIIDTKWKVMESIKPSDSDLKQMYTYNMHYGANRSILIYPYTNLHSTTPINYHPSEDITKEHSCQIYFMDIFDDEGAVRKNFARNFIRDIIN